MNFAGIDFSKKVGPIPLWGWGVGLGGIALAASYIHSKSKSGNTATNNPLINGQPLAGGVDTGTPDNTGGVATNTGSGSGDISAELTSSFTQLESDISQGFQGMLASQTANNAAVLAALQGLSVNQTPPSPVAQAPVTNNYYGSSPTQPPVTNPSNNNPVNPGGPNIPVGMTQVTTQSGLTFDIPEGTSEYFAQNPSELPTATTVAATAPNTEIAVPYVTPQTTLVGGGPYNIDVMPVR